MTSPTAFRVAERADSRVLAAIAREAYAKYAGLFDEPPAPILFDYEEVASSGRTYVAVEGGEVQGMVTIEESGGYLILRNLAVRPSLQRRGIGRKLVLLVEELARTRNLGGVRLWTRAEMSDNIAFYERLDYEVTHVERSATASRVHFRKELTPHASDRRIAGALASATIERSGGES
jgi:GNAT superfamily N-acetyltransferase